MIVEERSYNGEGDRGKKPRPEASIGMSGIVMVGDAG
jgi:hypothetical protein